VSNVAVTMRCLDASGTLVLDVTQAAGYEIVALDTTDRAWRSTRATAEDVEGHRLVQAVLDSATIAVTVRIKASSQANAETAWENLRNAVERFSWRLELGFDAAVETWVADPADSSKVRGQEQVLNAQRLVTLRVPVQPRTLEELA
jgi:hypothetical protein